MNLKSPFTVFVVTHDSDKRGRVIGAYVLLLLGRLHAIVFWSKTCWGEV